MKKRSWKLWLMAFCAVEALTACGGKQTTAGKADKVGEEKTEEDCFEWEDNFIVGLTESGKKQKSIVIPARCEGLKELPFHDTEVEEVRFESDRDIPLNGALGLSNLKKVELPGKLCIIGPQEFWQCGQLERITIPGTVTSIGDYAFQECGSLKEVNIEEGALESLGSYVFLHCDALESVTLPDHLASIGKGAFEQLENLKTITLPKGIKKIDDNAFLNSGVTDVYIPEEVSLDEIYETSFGAMDHKVTAHIKKGSWCDQNFEERLKIVFDEKSYE